MVEFISKSKSHSIRFFWVLFASIDSYNTEDEFKPGKGDASSDEDEESSGEDSESMESASESDMGTPVKSKVRKVC